MVLVPAVCFSLQRGREQGEGRGQSLPTEMFPRIIYLETYVYSAIQNEPMTVHSCECAVMMLAWKLRARVQREVNGYLAKAMAWTCIQIFPPRMPQNPKKWDSEVQRQLKIGFQTLAIDLFKTSILCISLNFSNCHWFIRVRPLLCLYFASELIKNRNKQRNLR